MFSIPGTFAMSPSLVKNLLFVCVYVCGIVTQCYYKFFRISNKNSTATLLAYYYVFFLKACYTTVDAKGVIILRYMAPVCKYEREPIYAPQIL